MQVHQARADSGRDPLPALVRLPSPSEKTSVRVAFPREGNVNRQREEEKQGRRAPIPSTSQHRDRTGSPAPRASDDDHTYRPRSFETIPPAIWIVFSIAVPAVVDDYVAFSLRLHT